MKRRGGGQAGRGHCLVCADPRQEVINAALALGKPSLRTLAQHFQIGAVSLGRHKKNHLSPALVTARQEQLRQGATTSAEQARSLVDEALAFLRSAKRSRNIQQGLQAIQQARATLELFAKLSGELDTRPELVVNIATSPDWIATRTALLTALVPFPEAARAAADALARVDQNGDAS